MALLLPEYTTNMEAEKSPLDVTTMSTFISISPYLTPKPTQETSTDVTFIGILFNIYVILILGIAKILDGK